MQIGMLRVSILIINHHGEEWVVGFLRGPGRQFLKDFEIILIDFSSSDHFPPEIQRSLESTLRALFLRPVPALSRKGAIG